MFRRHQAQNPSNPHNPSQKDNLPSWAKFHLKKCEGRVEYSAGIIMGHYLVVLVHDVIIDYQDLNAVNEPRREQNATLLAFNLQDHSVQKAEIPIEPFSGYTKGSAIFTGPEGQQGSYNFLKYGENQIIKYGGQFDFHRSAPSMICITVESFEPFKVRCEKIEDENQERFNGHTAQIYKDCMYVYTERKFDDRKYELWSFDLKNRSWKLCETTGEAPEFVFLDLPNSFIYQDNLYVYGRTPAKSLETQTPLPNQTVNGNVNMDMSIYNFGMGGGLNHPFHYDNMMNFGFPNMFQNNLAFNFMAGEDNFALQENIIHMGGYGGNSLGREKKSPLADLFMLNLSSLTWKKIAEKEKYLGACDKITGLRVGGAVYQDHLVTLEKAINSQENTLCFFNLNTKNKWSTFGIKSPNEDCQNWSSYENESITGGLMTYKNLVLSLNTTKDDQNLFVAIMNIENFGISGPKSAEEEHFSSLFMSQNESDVAFKIEEKVIPAHKKILMKKSKYFAGLFNSGMAESKQETIEIKDCEYEVFKECLRWIYQGKVSILDADQAIKLHILADKYVQEDLREKCLNFLTSIINMKNVYIILNFAHQEKVPQIKGWCMKTCKDHLNIENITRLIQYLCCQEDPKYKENNKEFRDLALNFVFDNFSEICENEKGNMQVYESFLVKNLEMDTISFFASFIGRDTQKSSLFEACIADLKEIVFSFVERNAEVAMISKAAKDFPHAFIRDFVLYTTRNLSKIKTEFHAFKNEKKRMEPNQKNYFDEEEEGHELKKTKKSDLAYENTL